MVGRFPAEGDIFLGRDTPDLCRDQDVSERSIVQPPRNFDFTGAVELERISSCRIRKAAEALVSLNTTGNANIFFRF
jgi:hypothetical protein